MKKSCLFFLVLVVGLSLVLGAQNGLAASKKLVFATNETPILTTEFWATVSERYMQQNPDVTVENIAQPASNIMMRDFLKTLLATDQFPDVMVMASPGDFVPSGALLPIPEEDLDYVAPAAVTGKFGGQLYVVPYKKMVGGVWYNKQIFEENGVSVPNTYAEFLEANKTLKAKGAVPLAMGLKDGWPQLVLASCMLSADLLVNNPNWGLDRNAGKTTFNSPEVQKTMEKYAQLVMEFSNEDMKSVTYSQMLELFFTGKTAMIVMGSWLQGEEQRLQPDFEVGYFPIPTEDGTKVYPMWVNEGLSINANTKEPELAKDFIKFFLSDQEWYGKFLKTEMLFPTSKEDVPYEKSPLRHEVAAVIEGMQGIEHWYDMTGDAALLPGLQTYFNKMTINIAYGKDIAKELALFDNEWKLANSNLQK
ncbi:MAG: extracellular solute-binding protein [bacterium]|nr:extracellular solute-binding protein [bacterium]